jgi:ubiquitin carboxyl-terminal hydrolase 1
MTGSLRKNHADVKFPRILDLGEWCLGTSAREEDTGLENWIVDPSKSMLRHPESESEGFNDRVYELRAVIAHYGRHENGHYICYRKHSLESFPVQIPKFAADDEDDDDDGEPFEHWFRLSDEDVSTVSESTVLGQGGAFMLFYELIDDEPPSLEPSVGTPVNEKEEIQAHPEPPVDTPSSNSSGLAPKPVIIGEIPSAEDISQTPDSAPKSDVSDMSTSSGWSEETAPDTNSSVLSPSPPVIMRTSSTTPAGPDNAENPERIPSPMITAN